LCAPSCVRFLYVSALLSRIVGQWSVCYVAQPVVLVGRTYWAIVGC